MIIHQRKSCKSFTKTSYKILSKTCENSWAEVIIFGHLGLRKHDSGVILGSSWDRLGVGLVLFWIFLGVVLGVVLGSSQDPFGVILGSFLAYLGLALG